MTEQQLLELFTRTLCDLLGDDDIVLTMTTNRADVPRWDSFNYINFIVIIETELKIRFKIADVESFADVGAIVRCAAALQSQEK